MSTLAQLRTGLTGLLEAAQLTAHDYLPPQVHPPVVLLEPSDPYVQDGDGEQHPFGTWVVTYDLYIITARATSQRQTTALDELIKQTVEAIEADWIVTEVERPYVLRIAEARYLATRLTATTTTTEL